MAVDISGPLTVGSETNDLPPAGPARPCILAMLLRARVKGMEYGRAFSCKSSGRDSTIVLE